MNQEKINHYQSKGYNFIPIIKEVIVDIDTPLSAYLKLADKPYSYLFESVEGGEKWGRYSIIGLEANTIIKVYDNVIEFTINNKKEKITVPNPLDWIDSYLLTFKVPVVKNLPDFNGGLVGYFGYEIIKYIETRLNKNNKDELCVPDILLMLSSNLVVFDNLANKAFLIVHINPEKENFADAKKRLAKIEKDLNTSISVAKLNIDIDDREREDIDFKSNFSKQEFEDIVRKIKKYIVAGDVMQVVPSQRLSSDFKENPISLYRALRLLNPSPYMFYLNLDDFYIVGSSPEILTRVKDDEITLRPLAGTRSRGKTNKEDKLLEKELLADEKEIAEHLMLIDLGRNDLGRIAKTGSVKVSDKMIIEKYSHVMHIVSNVKCKLKKGINLIDVIKATFPAGTLSGAPKIRAMEIINEIEKSKRGIYSGAVGYLSWNNNMDLAIAIRTAVIKDDKLYAQAGAGIVYDSVPETEWLETLHKAKAILKAYKIVKN